jgi:hypothetical protein
MEYDYEVLKKICNELEEVRMEFYKLSEDTVSVADRLEFSFLSLASTYKLILQDNGEVDKTVERSNLASKFYSEGMDKLDEVWELIHKLENLSGALLEGQRVLLKEAEDQLNEKEEGK